MSRGGGGSPAEQRWTGASKALRWISDQLALIGDDPDGSIAAMAARLPMERDVVTIIGQSAGIAAWQLETELIALAVPPGALARIVVSGAGGPALVGRLTPAGHLARHIGVPVEAPVGPVTLVPGGSLFAQAGWRRFGPDGSVTGLGRRVPGPPWESAIDLLIGKGPGELRVEPLPSGLWVHAAGGDALAGHLARGIPVDPDVPVLLIGRPGSPEISAGSLEELVEGLHPRILIAPYGQSLAACIELAERTAHRWGFPVETATGVPALDEVGRLVVVAVDAGGTVFWQQVHPRLRSLPAGGTRPTNPVGYLAGLPQISPGVYQLDPRWVAEPILSGVWVRPPFAGDAAARIRALPAAPDRFTIRVGLPGAPPSADVLPLLHALIARLPQETAKRLLVVPEEVHQALAMGGATQGTVPDLAITTVRAGLPRWWQPDPRMLSVLVEADRRSGAIVTDAGPVAPAFAGELIAASVRPEHRAVLLVSAQPVLDGVQQLVADQTQQVVISKAGELWRICRPRRLGAVVSTPIEAALSYPFDDRQLSIAVAPAPQEPGRAGVQDGPLDLREPPTTPLRLTAVDVALTAGPGIQVPFMLTGHPATAWELACDLAARRPGWVNRAAPIVLEIDSAEGPAVQLLANYLGTPVSVGLHRLATDAFGIEAQGRLLVAPRYAPSAQDEERAWQ